MVVAEAVRIPNYVVIPAVGIPLLFVTLVTALTVSSVKGPRKSKKEILEELRRNGSEEGDLEEKE